MPLIVQSHGTLLGEEGQFTSKGSCVIPSAFILPLICSSFQRDTHGGGDSSPGLLHLRLLCARSQRSQIKLMLGFWIGRWDSQYKKLLLWYFPFDSALKNLSWKLTYQPHHKSASLSFMMRLKQLMTFYSLLGKMSYWPQLSRILQGCM